jgi:hypothetical protein
VQGPCRGYTHRCPWRSCRDNHWDQCLIYVENAEICTFLEPVPDLVLPGLNTPRDRAGLWAGASRLGLGRLTLPFPLPPVHQLLFPRLSWFINGTPPTQTYLLNLLHPRGSVHPSVHQSIHTCCSCLGQDSPLCLLGQSCRIGSPAPC